MKPLNQRILVGELMDADDAPAQALARSFSFIQAVNQYLGGYRAILGHLKAWSRHWNRSTSEPIRILDIATGCADIPLAILRWADHAGVKVHITGVDRHAGALAIARKTVGSESRIELLQADALHLPFAPASFDYVITSMFLHHLPDEQVLTVLRAMQTLSTRGVIWNDLLRNRRAWLWIHLLTLGQPHIVRHDAVASVEAAFQQAEVLRLRDAAGLGYAKFHRHFGHRFTLAGEKK